MTSHRPYENAIRRIRRRIGSGALVSTASTVILVSGSVLALGAIGETAARVDASAAAVRPVALIDPEAAAKDAAEPLPAVLAAVRAAEANEPLPSSLTPPVDSLLHDFYFPPDGCTPPVRVSASAICRLGDTSSRRTILVFGDSHGQMWMPAILSTAQRDRWAVIPLVKVGCIPRGWTASASGECATWYRWAKQQVAALRPDVTLIIGSRAGTYDPRAAIKPIAALSTWMKRYSGRVIIVGDAPNQTREPLNCLLAADATMKTCTVTSKPSQLRTEARIQSDALRNGVGFIDTWPWFCAPSSASTSAYLCPLVIDQTITERDRAHMTQSYSLELATPFLNAFRQELPS
jgi:SGNH domain (fused to AT3 domains)